MHVDVSANTRSLSAAAGVGGRGGNSVVLSLSTDGGGCLAYELMPHKPTKFGPTYIYTVFTKTVGLDVIQFPTSSTL